MSRLRKHTPTQEHAKESLPQVLEEHSTAIRLLESTKEELSSVQKELARARVQLYEQKDAYKAMGFGIKTRLEETDAMIKREAERKERIQDVLVKLESDYVNLKEMAKNKREEYRELEERISAWRSEELQSKNRLEQSRKEQVVLTKEIESLESEVKTLREKRKQISDDLYTQKEEIIEKIQRLEEQKEWVQQKKHELFLLHSQMRAFAQEHGITFTIEING